MNYRAIRHDSLHSNLIVVELEHLQSAAQLAMIDDELAKFIGMIVILLFAIRLQFAFWQSSFTV